MKKKFDISVYSNSQNIHLNLRGKFDELSACQLNSFIERLNGSADRIIIHTESLDQVNPLGKTIFHRRMPIGVDHNLVFTGKHASEFKSGMRNRKPVVG